MVCLVWLLRCRHPRNLATAGRRLRFFQFRFEHIQGCLFLRGQTEWFGLGLVLGFRNLVRVVIVRLVQSASIQKMFSRWYSRKFVRMWADKIAAAIRKSGRRSCWASETSAKQEGGEAVPARCRRGLSMLQVSARNRST